MDLQAQVQARVHADLQVQGKTPFPVMTNRDGFKDRTGWHLYICTMVVHTLEVLICNMHYLLYYVFHIHSRSLTYDQS